MSAVRRAIEFLFTRVLRSRLGVALLLGVVILGIVGAARLLSGSIGDIADGVRGPAQPIVTEDPEAGDDGLTVTVDPTPYTSPGAPVPAAVARSFGTAWVAHRGVTAQRWLDELLPLATPELAEKLTGVDPAGVPADRLTGDPVVIPRSDSLVEVTIPVDSGELRLGLLATEGRWRVDTVDWSRG
ncbi:hypothetical protein [Plantactinospora sp. CA-290183]|uniref:hypothetical protein n=1 Tax=Plantactinospora sp. CA-290183 TaxID=3240006 RepID=UPI003D931F6B